MTERLQFEGHLAVKEKEAKKLGIMLEGLVKSLRENLDPFEKVEDLDTGLIAEQALDLASKHIAYKEILAEIAKAKKILGRAQ
jgi:hypothetical protein